MPEDERDEECQTDSPYSNWHTPFNDLVKHFFSPIAGSHYSEAYMGLVFSIQAFFVSGKYLLTFGQLYPLAFLVQ